MVMPIRTQFTEEKWISERSLYDLLQELCDLFYDEGLVRTSFRLEQALDEFLDESGRGLGPTKQSPGRTLSEAQGGEKTSHQEIPFVPAIFQISVPPEQVKYQDLFPALIQVASFSSRRRKLADAA
ncbi:MAG: hypothetical protein AAFN09_11935 [Pseudomonadota bacterium]